MVTSDQKRLDAAAFQVWYIIETAKGVDAPEHYAEVLRTFGDLLSTLQAIVGEYDPNTRTVSRIDPHSKVVTVSLTDIPG